MMTDQRGELCLFYQATPGSAGALPAVPRRLPPHGLGLHVRVELRWDQCRYWGRLELFADPPSSRIRHTPACKRSTPGRARRGRDGRDLERGPHRMPQGSSREVPEGAQQGWLALRKGGVPAFGPTLVAGPSLRHSPLLQCVDSLSWHPKKRNVIATCSRDDKWVG